MTLDDLQQRAKAIGRPYRADREKRARRLFIEERAVALRGHRELEFEIKSRISSILDIKYSAISFAGSTQLGFSVHKDRPFIARTSDLDVACIDVDLFQRAWIDIVSTTRAFSDQSVFGSRSQKEINLFQAQIVKRGMIRVEVMPSSRLSRKWRSLEDTLTRDYADIFQSISVAIYMNEYAFCWKQDSALSMIFDAMG